MRNDISIHTRLLLSLCTFVLPARWNTFVPSARWYGPLHCFPHTSSFIPLLPQNIHTMPPFFVSHPSFLSMLEYPVFHSAAQWAVWMCLVSYITSFLELLPPAQCHCITYPLLCATQWGSFFLCLFEAQIWSPNGDGIKLGAESQTSPPPQTQVIPWITGTCYITAHRNKVACSSRRFRHYTLRLLAFVLFKPCFEVLFMNFFFQQ